ncbi:MAG: DUF4340 domain-containing protein [Kiloniellales bacterium]|nr:DUF4340 domain-containing protein [Kiloniellales bacterium]
MSPRNFVILAVVTLATVAGAVYALREQPVTRQALQPEEPVFPLLQERLNDAAKLEVITAEGPVVLAREGEGPWTLPSKQGYPAREEGVREVILALRALKVAEPKTRKPEGFVRLQVEDVEGEGAKSRLVRVSAADGAVLAEALLGKQRPGALGDASGGIYYRTPGGAQAWLAAGTIELPEGERAWLQTDVVHIAANTVAGIEVAHADGSVFTATRAAEDKDFELADLPEGRKSAASKTAQLGAALAFVSFDEVAPAAEIDFVAAPNRSTVTTFDGVTVTVELGEAEGELWAKLTAALAEDAPAEEEARAAAEERVSEITARTEGWAYRLADRVVKRLLPKVEEYLEAEPEPAS